MSFIKIQAIQLDALYPPFSTANSAVGAVVVSNHHLRCPVPSIFKACLVMAIVAAATPLKVGTEILRGCVNQTVSLTDFQGRWMIPHR